MGRSVYVAGLGPGGGKSTIALGLAELISTGRRLGPVMRGLRRRVNDLSRGATVKDVVNTVAITAIQAAS